MKKKITKFNVELPDSLTEDAYTEDMKEYIADFKEYKTGGFWSIGEYVKKPVVGMARWDARYPKGYKSWLGSMSVPFNHYLSVLETLNEVIDRVNKLK